MSNQYVYKPFQFMLIDLLKVKWMRHYQQEFDLSSWERQFLKDIKRKTKLSIKQKDKIDEMYLRYRHGKRTYQPIVDMGDYDYAHNFDR